MNKIQLPSNIEDPVVLRRFLSTLSANINGSSLLTGTNEEVATSLVQILSTSGNADFWDNIADIDKLRSTILNYVQGDLETNILKNNKDIATITEQFGTFYEQALAASWYGLTVKAGGAVAGLEIGSLDPDVTTPEDESSYFRVIADNFVVGRAYEDLTQEEKDYLDSNGLPSFGTVYNEDKTPVPALLITWDSVNQVYKHFFNGIVNFNNVNNVPDFALSQDVTSQLANYLLTDNYNEDKAEIDNSLTLLQNQIDGSITTWFNFGVPSLLNYPAIDWATTEDKNKHLGDIYYNKQDGKAYRFAYENIDDSPDEGIIYVWILIEDSDITLALAKAEEAKAIADGKVTTFYTNTQPVAEGEGDIWINATTKMQYVWDGSFWRYIDNAVAINNGTTTINGGRIDTSVIGTGVIYNTGATESNYTMKIDLNNGEIHIK